MKKQFESVAKNLGILITDYKTYRSDFGSQVYEIVVGNHIFSDSYIIGEKGSKESVLERFKNEIAVINE